ASRLPAPRHRPARWGASRPRGSRQNRTLLRSPIFPGSGSTVYMAVACPGGHRARHEFKRQPHHGEQERSVWNGYYACTCYHPLFLFNQHIETKISSVLRTTKCRSLALSWTLGMALVLGGFSTWASAAVISAHSGSAADIQAAVNLAKTGDTITIPAGRFYFTGQVFAPDGIYIKGAGRDS